MDNKSTASDFNRSARGIASQIKRKTEYAAATNLLAGIGIIALTFNNLTLGSVLAGTVAFAAATYIARMKHQSLRNQFRNAAEGLDRAEQRKLTPIAEEMFKRNLKFTADEIHPFKNPIRTALGIFAMIAVHPVLLPFAFTLDMSGTEGRNFMQIRRTAKNFLDGAPQPRPPQRPN